MAGPTLTPREAAKITQAVTLASVATALVLTGLKAWGWLASGSVALLSSLADSGLDLAASLVTLLAVRWAAQPPDHEHRYGHGKAEAFAGLFQAGLVAIAATLVVIEGVARLIEPDPARQTGLGLAIMAVSMLLTAGLVAAQGWAVRRTASIATKGDRAHYLSDFLANACVLIGLAVTALTGWSRADAIAGIVVALWLGHSAWTIARDAADHLLDRELPDADRARIAALAREDGAIRAVHGLRTRTSGAYLHVQFHAELDARMSLADAHAIMVAAERRIIAGFPGADVLIHPDPGGVGERHGHPDFADDEERARLARIDAL
jgi:ferrous-iron efflux pump FieF